MKWLPKRILSNGTRQFLLPVLTSSLLEILFREQREVARNKHSFVVVGGFEHLCSSSRFQYRMTAVRPYCSKRTPTIRPPWVGGWVGGKNNNNNNNQERGRRKEKFLLKHSIPPFLKKVVEEVVGTRRMKNSCDERRSRKQNPDKIHTHFFFFLGANG